MSLPVTLSAVVDELDSISDDTNAYIHRKTGELITVSNEEMGMVEDSYDPEECPDWQRELLAQAEKVLDSTDYVKLPSSYDIHEWKIMEAFCHTLSNERQSNILLDQIHSKGAFRKFKDTLHRYDISDEWFAFRRAALERIAIDFLENEKIPYTT